MSASDDVRSAIAACGLREGDLLGLAVSGGADSMAMLLLAADAASATGVRLHVLHVDHALRPGSAADARVVSLAAEAAGVPWTVLRPASPAAAFASEAAARGLRYTLLEHAADALACRFVATAHTMDDQAETVLMRALRGTGPAGLAGIPRMRGRFLRPLLGVRRAELRAVLAARGVGWAQDPTNADPAFERNWLRTDVLPIIESRRPGAVPALARLASLAARDAAALDLVAAEAYAAAARTTDAVVRVSDRILEQPEAVWTRVLRTALEACGGIADTDATASLRSLAGQRAGASIDCRGGVCVYRLDGELAFVAGALAPPAPATLPLCGERSLGAWRMRVRVSREASEPWTWRCRLSDVSVLEVRSRLPGDRVATPAGTRKVQDVMVDAKVPRFARNRVPVLVADGRPVAVVGLCGPPPARAGILVDVEPEGDTWWIAARRSPA